MRKLIEKFSAWLDGCAPIELIIMILFGGLIIIFLTAMIGTFVPAVETICIIAYRSVAIFMFLLVIVIEIAIMLNDCIRTIIRKRKLRNLLSVIGK